jgi:predicted TPR repeat methyltransferase
MTTDERQWLSWICENSDPKELEKKYNTWAETYETDVKKDWSFMPVQIAKVIESNLSNKQAVILDAGAGTGLVGEALFQRGYTHLIAADLSDKMLEIAGQKQVYKALQRGNLDDPQLFTSGDQFDVIIAAGVFAYAHAGVSVLNNLFRFLKSGGLFVLTIREDYQPQMQSAFEALPWRLVIQEQYKIYDGQQIMSILGFRKN